MKKVLVTGGAGYIGCVMVRQLLDKGYSVRVIDSLKWGGESLFDLITNNDFELQKGDIKQIRKKIQVAKKRKEKEKKETISIAG